MCVTVEETGGLRLNFVSALVFHINIVFERNTVCIHEV